ncbi:hypothetical protein Cni_G07690 [Canna indica]|uniref:Uncharacterized protein n=1 Tax=Canna indica TaxID=4628 RepID=A0AAQ3Q611_9LILI|nr:hypothetical protein Cni_G07690 [Canna indica]
MHERILHVHASVPSPSPPCDPSRILRNLPFSGEIEPAAKCSDNLLSPISQPGDFVDVAKLMRDLDEEDDGKEFVLVSNRRKQQQ